MPFLSLAKNDLQKVLSICNQISPKRSDIDIFTNIKVELNSDVVKIFAINPNVFYSTTLKPHNLDLQNDTVFLIKTEMLASSIAVMNDDLIGLDINIEKSTLTVQGSKSKHILRIDTQTVQDFLTPQESKESLEIALSALPSDFIKATKAAFVSVGQPKNVYQPEFLNICLTFKSQTNEMVVVSTDRFRVSKYLIPVETLESKLSEESKNFLINPKSLQLLNSAIDGLEKAIFNFENDYLWVEFPNGKMTIRYGEGKYPDYEKIIPQSFTCNFIIDSKEILEGLKQVYFSAKFNSVNKSVSLSVEPSNQKIVLKAETQNGETSESSVSISNYEGLEETWTQSFNADYLIDYLSNVESEKVLWESNPGKPSVLSPENLKAKQLYLVSGLR